eukprot:TRINITY_DN8496_c0_g1_i3.p1 TRINITY_DN8496_c0_g1~~TRINITY_DN8496_c0_g1_i3.p1  ORF type:complete len:197 (-),score=62.88 TRINITY_DN8496_c0_g1_i3:89-679(-)
MSATTTTTTSQMKGDSSEDVEVMDTSETHQNNNIHNTNNHTHETNQSNSNTSSINSNDIPPFPQYTPEKYSTIPTSYMSISPNFKSAEEEEDMKLLQTLKQLPPDKISAYIHSLEEAALVLGLKERKELQRGKVLNILSVQDSPTKQAPSSTLSNDNIYTLSTPSKQYIIPHYSHETISTPLGKMSQPFPTFGSPT